MECKTNKVRVSNKGMRHLSVTSDLQQLIENIRNCDETASIADFITSFGTEKFYKLIKSESFDDGFTQPLTKVFVSKNKTKKKQIRHKNESVVDTIVNIIWLRLFSSPIVSSRLRFKVNTNLKRVFDNFKNKKGIFNELEMTDSFENDMREANRFYSSYLETSNFFQNKEMDVSQIDEKFKEISGMDKIENNIFNHFLIKHVFEDENKLKDRIELEKYNVIDLNKDLEYTPQEMLVLLSTSKSEDILDDSYRKIESMLEKSNENKSGVREKLFALDKVKNKKNNPEFVFDNRWVKKSKRATLRQGNVEDKNLDRIDNKAKFKKDQLKMKFSKLSKRKRAAGRK